LRRIVQQSGVSVGSAWKATKLLQITVAPEIKPMVYGKRVSFCYRFVSHVHDGLLDLKVTFFRDEVNVNLSG
jgi:hypothetical protein